MEQNFKCSGNCLNCTPAQRAYCASQHAYSNMKVLDNVMIALNALQNNVKALSEKIEAIQNNEASVFDPSSEGLVMKSVSTTEIAQSGVGAESRNPETIKN